MFGIGGTELFIIVVFVLLIFGPDKLPGFARTIGQMMREFKRAQETMEQVIKAEVYADRTSAKNSGADVESDDPDDEADEELEDESDAEPDDEPGDESADEPDADAEAGTEPEAKDTAATGSDVADHRVNVNPSTPEEAGGWTPGKNAPVIAEPEKDDREEDEEAL